jgi:hypothetical protein
MDLGSVGDAIKRRGDDLTVMGRELFFRGVVIIELPPYIGTEKLYI